MTTSLEQRLRAHLADVAAQALPGPDAEAAYVETVRRAADQEASPQTGPGSSRFPLRPLMVAAAILAIGLVAGVLVVARPDGSTTTGPGPDDEVDADPTTPPTSQTQQPGTTETPSYSVLPPVSITSVVVGSSGPLGWWDGASWHPGYEAGRPAAVPVSGGEQYQIVGLRWPPTTAVGRWGDGCGISEEPGSVVHVEIPRDEDWPTPTGLAVTGVANPQVRPTRLLRTGSEEYRAAAADVLTGLGISDAEPDIVQVVAADLDGDGTDEVLVVAERAPLGPDGYYAFDSAEDYSVAFVRQVVGGAVRTTVLHHSSAQPVEGTTLFDIELVRVAAAADFNGDGRMEVAMETLAWEYQGASLLEMGPAGDFREVLAASC